MCRTVQYSKHGHICRYFSKSYRNVQGHGRYRVNTMHIPCTPSFYLKFLIYKILIFHEMYQNLINVNDFNVMKNEYIPAIYM